MEQYYKQCEQVALLYVDDVTDYGHHVDEGVGVAPREVHKFSG